MKNQQLLGFQGLGKRQSLDQNRDFVRPRQQGKKQQERDNRNVLTQKDKQQLRKRLAQVQKTLPQQPARNGVTTRTKVQQLIAKKRQQGYLIPRQQRTLDSMLGIGKPSRDKIYQDYQGLRAINFKPTRYDDINMQSIRQVIQQGFAHSQKYHQTPRQVVQQLMKKQSPTRKMYDKLKNYCGSALARQKLQRAAYGKLRMQTARKFKVPLHDADIILLLDDFIQVHPQHQQQLGEHRRQMQRHARDIMEQTPGFKSLSGFSQTHFGGQILSEDPYCIDVDYVKHVFGSGIPYPAPRKQNHYMYQMATTIQVPITTLSDGTALLTIAPSSSFIASAFIANGPALPFISVASGNTTFPFAAAPAFVSTAFNSQYANTISFAIDSLQIDFIQTESPINVKGKLTTAFYYQPPNATWNVDGTNGNYVTANISITDTQLTNDSGYVSRKSCNEALKLSRIGTMIIEQSRSDTIPIFNFGQQAILEKNSDSYIFVKFTGCTPNTVIGTAFVRVAASIEPIANMRGILKVTPRGSYQGVFRAFKQARKMGIPLQFLQSHQAYELFKNNYADINFHNILQQLPKFGEGSAIVPPLFQLSYNPQNKGFCMSESLKYLGHQVPHKPWLDKTVLQGLKINIISIVNKQISQVQMNDPKNNQFLTLNYDQKHVYVLKALSNLCTFQQWGSVGNNNQWVQIQSYCLRIHEDQFAQTVQFFPINIMNLPHSFVDKIIRQRIILAPGISLLDPLISFNLDEYRNLKIYCKNGSFTIVQNKMYFTQRSSKTLSILVNPSVADVQTITGQLVTITGKFAQFDQSFYISNAFQSGTSLILNQSALQAFVQYSLMTIQKNPGPSLVSRTDTFKYFKSLKDKPRNHPRRFLRVARQLGKLVYYQDSKQPTLIADSDVQIQDEQDLITKVSNRTLLNVAVIKGKLGL